MTRFWRYYAAVLSVMAAFLLVFLVVALAGAVAQSFGSAVLIFCSTLIAAGGFWLVERRVRRTVSQP